MNLIEIRLVMDVMNLTNFSLVFELTNYIMWNLFSFYIPNEL